MATTVGEVQLKLGFDAKSISTSQNEVAKKVESDSDKLGAEAGNKFSTAFKVGVVAAGAALVATIKSAVDQFGEFEQLTGGVEAMFGGMESQINMIGDTAAGAWKTLTMSQNDYYKTFTSTYPLIKSSVEDTNDAIGLTNELMTLESDLANTFGYSMETATDAINWALKGSFNYIDNLNLGIKGTQEGFLEAAHNAGIAADSVQDLSAEDIVRTLQYAANNFGVMGRTAEEASNTVQGSIKEVGAAWDNFLLSLTTDRVDTGQAIQDLTSALGDLARNVLPVIGQTLGSMFTTIWQAQPVLTSIAIAVGAVATAIWAVNAATKAWALAQAAWNTVTKVAAGVQAAFNAVLSANPIFKLIAVIAAVVAGLIWFFTQTELGQAILENIGQIIGEVFSFLGQLFQSIGEWIAGVWNNIVAFFTAVFTFIGGVAQWVWDNVLSPIINFFIGYYTTIWNIITGIVTFVIAILTTVVQWIWESVISPIINFVVGLWTTITEIISGIWNTICSVIGAIAQWMWDNVISPIINFYVGLYETIAGIINGIWNTICGVFSAIGGWIYANVIAPIAGFFEGLWNGIRAGVEGLVSGIQQVFGVIAGIVKAPINGIISGINGVIDGINSIQVPDWVPVIGGASANIPHIPTLAEGGYAKGATNAIIGEAGEEVVLPLSRNTDNWAGLLADTLVDAMDDRTNTSGGIVVNMTNNINNKMDAEEVGRLMMNSIRRAAA